MTNNSTTYIRYNRVATLEYFQHKIEIEYLDNH